MVDILQNNILNELFSKENLRIVNKISLKYACWYLIGKMSALFQIIAWHRAGDKPLCDQLKAKFTYTYASQGLSMLMKPPQCDNMC